MKYDLIIIGGGPAGITAGIYSARQGLNTLLITKEFGGQIGRKAVDIENYPGFKKISGPDLINKFVEHLRAREIKIEKDIVVSVEKEEEGFLVKTKDKNEFQAKAVIVTSGADPRPLEVKGEKEFVGKGVSYCALCDGAVFPNKEVAVIGGGNAGFEAALFLSNYVKKIYILEYGAEIKADEKNQEAIRKSGKAEIITNAALKEIRGDKFVKSIIYLDRKNEKEKTLEVEGVFVEIGSQPANCFVKDLVDFSKRGEIKVDPRTCETKTPGLFAAGDVTDIPYKQIVIAAGEGTKALLSAYKYLRNLE